MNEFRRSQIIKIVIVITITLTFSFGIFQNPQFEIHDFLSGLSAEFLGMVFAVVVVETYISIRLKQRNTNSKKVQKKELESFLHEIIAVYSEAYKACTPSEESLSIKELFSRKTFATIYEKIDLNGQIPFGRLKIKWASYLSVRFNEQTEKGYRIIAQYADDLEEEAVMKIHRLLDKSFLVSEMRYLKEYCEEQRAPRVFLGELASVPTEEELDDFLFLCADAGIIQSD